MEKGPERERKIWPHGFLCVTEEDPRLQETGQCLIQAARHYSGICSIKVVYPLSIFFLSQVTEIQRVWSLHNVLLTLDYTAEDNNEMIDLLLECFHRPLFIKNDNVGCDSVTAYFPFALLSC